MDFFTDILQQLFRLTDILRQFSDFDLRQFSDLRQLYVNFTSIIRQLYVNYTSIVRQFDVNYFTSN